MTDKKIEIIMLVGAGHSGSTLLDLVMDSHSKIVGVGELSHYSKHINSDAGFCSCGDRIKKCPFWNKVFRNSNLPNTKMIYRYGFDFLMNNKNFFYYGAKGERKASDSLYIKEMEGIYSRIIKYSGKKIIFDSSKNYERAEILSKSSKLNITLLHLVRDGRGVAYSHLKLKRKVFPYMKEWFFTNIKTEVIKNRNRNVKKLFVLYEDFARKPEKIISYILKEVGVSYESKMLDFRNTVHHQPGGNFKLRIQTRGGDIKLDEKWRVGLPIKSKIIFNLFFGWLNVFYKLKPKKYDR